MPQWPPSAIETASLLSASCLQGTQREGGTRSKPCAGLEDPPEHSLLTWGRLGRAPPPSLQGAQQFGAPGLAAAELLAEACGRWGVWTLPPPAPCAKMGLEETSSQGLLPVAGEVVPPVSASQAFPGAPRISSAVKEMPEGPTQLWA